MREKNELYVVGSITGSAPMEWICRPMPHKTESLASDDVEIHTSRHICL